MNVKVRVPPEDAMLIGAEQLSPGVTGPPTHVPLVEQVYPALHVPHDPPHPSLPQVRPLQLGVQVETQYEPSHA